MNNSHHSLLYSTVYSPDTSAVFGVTFCFGLLSDIGVMKTIEHIMAQIIIALIMGFVSAVGAILFRYVFALISTKSKKESDMSDMDQRRWNLIKSIIDDDKHDK
jgi:phosphate/sulfate permease